MALHLCSQCFRLSILWRYMAVPRRYPKMEKRNLSPTIPLIISTQPHLQISKGENPTQSNSQWNWHIPNQIQHIQFRTKNSGKNINVPNHVFQNTSWTQHAPTSRNLSPQLNATKQVNALSFQMGCICQADLQRLVKKKSYLQKKSVQHNKLHVLWYKVCQPPPSSSL